MNYNVLKAMTSKAILKTSDKDIAISKIKDFVKRQKDNEQLIVYDYSKIDDILGRIDKAEDKNKLLYELSDYLSDYDVVATKCIRESIERLNSVDSINAMRPKTGKNDELDLIVMEMLFGGYSRDLPHKSKQSSYSQAKKKRPLDIALMKLGLDAVMRQ